MSPTPGAGPSLSLSLSRRSSGSSQSTTSFATPPSSPKLSTSVSRIPKLAPSPGPHTPSIDNALSRSSSSGDRTTRTPNPHTPAPGPAPPHFPAAPSPSSLPVPVHNKLLARKSMSAAIPHSSRRASQYYYAPKNSLSPSASIPPTAIPVFRGANAGPSSGNVSNAVTPTPSPAPPASGSAASSSASTSASTGRGIARGASPAAATASAMRRTSSAEGRRAARTHHREGHAPPMPPPLPPGAAPPLGGVAGTASSPSPSGGSSSSGIPRRQKSSSSLGRRKSHIPTSNTSPSPRARPMSVKPPARVSSAAASAVLSAQHHPPLPTSPPIPNGSPGHFGYPNGLASSFTQDLPLRSASLRATSDPRPASPPPPTPAPAPSQRIASDATFPPPEPQFRRPDATHSPGQPSTSSVDVDDGHRHVDDHSPARPNGVARRQARPSRSSTLSSASVPSSPTAPSHGFQHQVGPQPSPPKDEPTPRSPRTATSPRSPTTPLSPPLSSSTAGTSLPLRNESLPQANATTSAPPLASSPTRSSSLAPEPSPALRSSTSSQGSTTTVVPDPIETEVPPLPNSSAASHQAATSPVSTVSSTATPGSPEAASATVPAAAAAPAPAPAPAPVTALPNGRVTPDNSRNAKSPESPRAPRTSPRPDRKSPGLTIDPPPPPTSAHNIRVVSPPPITAPQPSTVPPAAVPIIPAKSPLRPRTGRLRSGTNTAVPPVPKLPDNINIPPVPQRPSSVHHVSSTLQLPESEPSASASGIGAAGQPPGSESSGVTARAEEANQTTDSATEEPSAVTTASSTSSEPRTSPSVAVPSQQALAAAILAPVQNTYGGIPLTARSDPVHSPESSAQPFAKDLSSLLLASPIPFDDSGPPSAPASSQNIWVVSSGGSASRPTSFLDASTSTASTISTSVSTTDSLLGRSEASIMEDAPMYDKRESLDDEIISPTALSQGGCDLCPSPTNCPHTTLKKQTSLARVTPLNLDVHSKVLPELPLPSPNQPLSPRTPTTPARPQHAQQSAPPRSPSMPTLVRKESPSSVASQTTTESHDHLVPRPRMRGSGPDGRSNTTGHSPRPQSMVITGSPLPSPISPSLSRRAHLIREIAHTERTHATDLALVTDAYVGRVLRTDSGLSSQGSTAVEAESNASTNTSTPGAEAAHRGHARRPSYGLAADEHGRMEGSKRNHQERRMSGQDSAWAQAWSGLMSPVLKSPKERDGHHQGNGSMDGMYQSSAGGSASSFQMVTPPGQSPHNTSAPASASTNNGFTRLGGIMNPQSGKPLSSWDIKAVFLNINELAYISDELAKEFDQAIGDTESDPGTPGGDSGGDRMGEVFMKMLPRLRPLYTFYCSRQAAASKRLLELQQDPGYAQYLNDCWGQVKSHTHAWNLDSMLIKPVQRITKYPLLFEDLLACTAPSHPDYHSIQKAAEGARTLALEIDEAKRRKDVISSVMGKSQSTISLVKDPKAGSGGRLLNLRRFKKDKLNGGGGDNGPPEITPYAQAQLKELVAKIENSDKQVRRMTREVIDWVNANKLLLLNGRDTNLDLLRWYTLEGRVMNDVRAAKVAAYKSVLDSCINTIWQEMQERINNSVLAVLGKMIDAARNPLAIIDRLNRKSADYARYQAHRHAKKSIDRLMIQEATDYVAIHTQLLEELPVFLEGYSKIFELAVCALTMAQTRYYANMRDITRAFTSQFLSEPTESRLTETGEIQEVPIDITTARGIHKAWLDKFLAPNNIAKGLLTTSGDFMRHSDGTSESRKGPSSRSTSRSDMRSPNLRHAPSFITRPKSRTDSRAGSESRNGMRAESRTEQLRSESRAEHTFDSGDERANRRRSRSLSGQSTAVSDSESSSRFASLIRRNSQRNGSAKNRHRSLRPPMPDGFMAEQRKANEHTLSVATSEDRLSSHTQQSQQSADSQRSQNSQHTQNSGVSQDSRLSMSPQSHMSQLEKTMSHDSTAEEIASRLSFGLPRIHTESTPLLFDGFGTLSKASPVYRTVVGDEQTESPLEMTPTDLAPGEAAAQAQTTSSSPRSSVTDVDGDPWAATGINYACAVVAEFSPKELGDRRFMGLPFLTLEIGREVEVRHEIGRVAVLPNFPYAHLGVENDGAVVCRSEDGQYGIAMCSFLEPIQDPPVGSQI